MDRTNVDLGRGAHTIPVANGHNFVLLKGGFAVAFQGLWSQKHFTKKRPRKTGGSKTCPDNQKDKEIR